MRGGLLGVSCDNAPKVSFREMTTMLRSLVRLGIFFIVFSLSGTAGRAGAIDAAESDQRPNIVFVIADDLGYGDVGCFGQTKIRTPHVDELAKRGMRLTQHYAGNAVCAPSRCTLMTGMHPGHAQVRNNREVQPEGQHPLRADTLTLARALQQLGYATGGFGKWGLGAPDSAGQPLKQGFDRWFGYNCQRVAHNHYPTYLWDDDRRFPLNNAAFAAHQRLPEGADPNDPASYAGYAGSDYAMDVIAEQAVKFVRDHQDRPFFVYFPTVIPHLALQAPKDALAEYDEAFPETPYPGGQGYLPHRTPRAAYAAMVTRQDKHLGMLMEEVDRLGLTERTIFVFTSDNGPVGNRHGGTDEDFFNSAAGLRGRKGSLYEGGVRVPTVVAWQGQIAAGGQSGRVTGFEDWLPTLLELASAPDQTPADIDGISFAPTLRGQRQQERPFLYREFSAYGGQQSVRIGDWKGVRQNLNPATARNAAGKKKVAAANLRIQLYNVKDDPHEATDVSAQHPEIVDQIAHLMRDERTASVTFPFPALDNQ
jgi:arylsulfatase A